MNYIRTKSKIYEVESEFLDNEGKWIGYNIVEDDMAIILRSQVINQADTIEELCDELVVISKTQNFITTYSTATYNLAHIRVVIDHLNDRYVVKGAIWTDKGLIYVAKMNDKGELELI